MLVVDAEMKNVRRNRDFGRVEALVTLFVKQRGQPIRPLRIRTNVADHGSEPLRARLLADAARLARHFDRRPSQGDLDRVA